MFTDHSLRLFHMLNSLHAARMTAAVAKARSDPKTDDATFACSCGKSYVHYNSLWRHKKYECGRTPQFHCNICSAKYMQKNALEIHFRVKHGLGRWWLWSFCCEFVVDRASKQDQFTWFSCFGIRMTNAGILTLKY